jgi:predicted AlkP superfamily phosphohydrolase/phosphomutase
MAPEDNLIMMSDHGMERTKFNVNINAYLEEKGYLNLSDDESKKKYNRIEEGTQAFALEHGRVYLNRRSRYPKGSVDKEEEDDLLEKLKDDLKELEVEGESVVSKIWGRDEIYSGDQVDKAPDLVLIPNSGYNLRGKLSDEIYEESPFSGMHDRNAFLYVRGDELTVPDSPTVEDVVPIMRSGVGG